MKNQDGSVILIAIMLLLLMTIIGISGSRTSRTESFILRNTAIHAQNISLVETAALELAEKALIDIVDPANPHLAQTSPVKEPWIIPMSQWSAGGSASKETAWYSLGTGGGGRVLSGAAGTVWDPYFLTNRMGNANFPQWVQPEFVSEMTVVDDDRGETGAPLRTALVGWVTAPGASLKGTTKSTRKRAMVISEYISPLNGMMRLELGVEREF